MGKGYKRKYTDEELKIRRHEIGVEFQKKYNQMAGKGLQRWRERDPEGMAANARKQCAANRKKGPEALAKWKAEHPDWKKKTGEYLKQRRAEHEHTRSVAHRAWREKNTDLMKKNAQKMADSRKKVSETRKRSEDLGIKLNMGQYPKKEQVSKANKFLDILEQKLNEKSPT